MSALNRIGDIFSRSPFSYPAPAPSTRIPNTSIDVFLRLVYEQYRRKGVKNIVLDEILRLLSVLLVGVVYTVLVHCVDYNYLRQGTGELFKKPFVSSSSSSDEMETPPAYTIIVWIGCGVWAFIQLIWAIVCIKKHAQVAHKLEKFGVSQDRLESAKWEEVVHQLSRTSNFCYDEVNHRSVPHTDLNIVSRICRLDNYLIALFNLEKLNLRLPIGGKMLVSQAMEHALKWSLFSINFGPSGVIDRGYNEEQWARQLRKRIIIGGILLIPLSPFIAFGMLLYLALKYGLQLKENASAVVGGKQWSALAHWKLRYINEMPHFFECRLRRAKKPAKKYDEQIPPAGWLTVIARFGQFVFGGIFLILLLFSVISSEFVYQIWDISSVLAMTIVTGALGVCYALLPKEVVVSAQEEYLLELCKRTGYCPQRWIGRAHTPEVQEEFSTLYEMRALSWLSEFLSIFCVPWVMLFSLASEDSVIAIAHFFLASTTTDPVVGNVCLYSLFVLSDEDDEPDDNVRGVEFTGRFSQSISRSVPHRLKNQKLEMSVLAFILNYRPHPVRMGSVDDSLDDIRTWKPTRSTKNVIQGIFAAGPPVALGEESLENLDGDSNKSSKYAPPVSDSAISAAQQVIDEPDGELSAFVLSSIYPDGSAVPKTKASSISKKAHSPAYAAYDEDDDWEDALDPVQALERAFTRVHRRNFEPITFGHAIHNFVKDDYHEADSQPTTTTTTTRRTNDDQSLNAVPSVITSSQVLSDDDDDDDDDDSDDDEVILPKV